MISGTFACSTDCPQIMGYQLLDAGLTPIMCQQPCNVYDVDGSGSLTSICSGSSGVHQQFFGAYYLNSVVTGSDPAW